LTLLIQKGSASMQRVLAAAFALAAGTHGFNIDEHRIKGSMIAVYTPMKYGSLELDLDRVPAYAAYVAARNITNVMPAGSNGESLSLSVPERKALAEAWSKAGPANGLTVYMHVGSESLVESMELAAHAASTPGISGILSMTPVYFKPTVGSLVDFMANISSAAPSLPFWFYHFPDDTGVLPGKAHEFLELADSTGKIPNLMGIKYTDYNMMDFSLCKQVKGGKYNMLYGRDEQAMAGFLFGAEAAVSSTIGYAPSLREAVQLWASGDQAGAMAKQALNAKLCSFFAQYETKAENVQKSIMRMTGMDVGPSRLPKQDLSREEYIALEAQLRSLNLLDAK